MALPVGSEPASERWPRQAVLVALLGGSVSVALSAMAMWRNHEARREEFVAQSAALLAATNEHMHQAVGATRALQAFWNSSRAVEPAEFEAFAHTLIAQYAHVEGLLWIERVAPQERSAWRRRAELASGQSIDIRNSRGASVVADRECWPITLHHPRGPSRWALGLDVRTLVGPDVELVRPSPATDAQPLVVALAGLELGPSLPGDEARRALVALPARGRASLSDATGPPHVGWVAVVLRVEQMARDAAQHVGVANVHVTIEPFRDGREPGAFEARGPLLPGPPDWTVVARAQSGYATRPTDYTPWAMLALGLGLSGLLAQRVRTLELRREALSRANAELYTEVAGRHSVETKLRETQRALATLVANLPGVAYRCSNAPDWPMEFISDGCAALTGHPARDYLDGIVRYGRDVIHVDDRDYVWNGVQQALERHRPFQLVYRIVTSNGQLKWVWEQGRGVYSRADELLAIEGLLSDITERKLAEEGLKREMRFVETIIDSLPGNFYVFDEGGRFLRWNANVEKVTGFAPLELAAMNPVDFFAGADRERVARAVTQVFEEGRTALDARLRTKDGGSIPFHFTGVLFSYDGARYLVGVGIDVSERERALAEQALVRTQLLHTSKLESLGVVASGVAHDFNNMLTVVLASAGLAQSSVDPSSDAHAFLQQILSASQNASEITRQLLTLARGEAAPRGPTDVTEVVQALEKLLRSSIKRRVRIEYELVNGLHPIQAETAQLRQLIVNLALNAGEACLERGGVVRIATGERSYESADLTPPAFRGQKRAGRHVYVEVLDDGAGMDAATLERLGEPFFTTRVAGRGLGLAAVLGILKTLGGWLELESAPGKGTLARACIPAL
jgi:PAS domain S-box-containing protein